MSIGINLVVLYGHLGKDPELKQTAGGPVLKLNLATGRRWKDKEANKHEDTQWHRVTVFGRYAETLSRILTKGMGVTVRGRLETSSYEKDGQRHWSTQIIAEDVAAGAKGGAYAAAYGSAHGAGASSFADTGPSSSFRYNNDTGDVGANGGTQAPMFAGPAGPVSANDLPF